MSIFFGALVGAGAGAGFLTTGASIFAFLAGFTSTSSDLTSLAFFGLDILSIAFLEDGLEAFSFLLFFGFDLGRAGGSSGSSDSSFGSSTSALFLSSFFSSYVSSAMNFSRASSRMGAISPTSDDLLRLSLI